MKKYSAFSLLRNAISYNRNWQKAWRSPEPKRKYDVVIVGGGGHGLATAYYLAKEHGVRNIAVLEKGWIGGGNTGRNTTIVRSNYLWTEAALLYEKSLKLWEGLSQELNYNVMFSQRGVYNLGHSLQDMRDIERRVSANRLNGIDAVVVNPQQIKAAIPLINTSANTRYPILGASLQARGGVARHDAVAWGFARAADAYGVDIIQQCEVTGIKRDGGRVTGVETTRGAIEAGKVGVVVAGNASVLASMAELRLPIESHPLQAFVSEPMKPVLDTVVMSNAVHGYVSQSDKGELVIGAGIDAYNGYGQRGSFHTVEHAMAAIIELVVSDVQSRSYAQDVGRYRRRLSGCLPDYQQDTGGWPVFQLRLGHRRIQGDARLGLGVCAYDSAGPTARAQCSVRFKALHERRRFTSGALIDEHGAAGVAH
jgi:sarcosine oxidase subunit beta